MSSLDAVKFIERDIISDHRGWLLKVLTGTEDHLGKLVGEIYLTEAIPGQARGNHFHLQTQEWFTVIKGKALLIIGDPTTSEQRKITLSSSEPKTVFIPAGISHVFINPDTASEPMLLIAYADRRYDPHDTIQVNLL